MLPRLCSENPLQNLDAVSPHQSQQTILERTIPAVEWDLKSDLLVAKAVEKGIFCNLATQNEALSNEQ